MKGKIILGIKEELDMAALIIAQHDSSFLHDCCNIDYNFFFKVFEKNPDFFIMQGLFSNFKDINDYIMSLGCVFKHDFKRRINIKELCDIDEDDIINFISSVHINNHQPSFMSLDTDMLSQKVKKIYDEILTAIIIENIGCLLLVPIDKVVEFQKLNEEIQCELECALVSTLKELILLTRTQNENCIKTITNYLYRTCGYRLFGVEEELKEILCYYKDHSKNELGLIAKSILYEEI